MEFSLTSEQVMIADLAKQLFADLATSARTRAAMTSGGIDRELWSSFAGEAGLAGLAIPESYGGAGLGLVEMTIVTEAAGRHLATLPLIASSGLVAPAVVAGGSASQRERWLPALAAGTAIGAVAMLDHARVKRGRLSGLAPRVSHGGCADILIAVLDETAWLVRCDRGVSRQAQASMDQTRPLDRLVFDDAAAEPLEDPAAALAAIRRWGWTLIGADALGGSETCLKRTADYARERVQFGRPIGAFQAVKHALANVAVEVEQARSAVYWAAAEPGNSADFQLASHAAKAIACETYAHAAAAMIQLHGGIGFTWEHDAHLFFKRAQSDRSWMGTPDWHFDRIAEQMALDAA